MHGDLLNAVLIWGVGVWFTLRGEGQWAFAAFALVILLGWT